MIERLSTAQDRYFKMWICHILETFSRRVLEVAYQVLNKSLTWLGKPEITKAGNTEWTGSGSSGQGRCFHGELVEYFEVDDGGIGSFVILLHESLEGTISILQYSYLLLLFTVTHIEKEFLFCRWLGNYKDHWHFGDRVCSFFFFFKQTQLDRKSIDLCTGPPVMISCASTLVEKGAPYIVIACCI